MPDLKNSESFLNSFTRIEKQLRRISGAKPWMPFVQLVARLSKSSPVVRRFREDLKEFADLRNAIVHDRMHDEVIAEPNDWAVERIAKIAELLTAPPAVVPLFEKKVFTIRDDQPVIDAIRLMRQHDFSKIPVIDRSRAFRGLLTSNTITRWLGGTIDGGVIDLKKTNVGDVLRFAEEGQNELFVAPSATVFEVFEHFHRVESRGRTLEAILITESGAPSDRILGIITVADLPKILPLVETAREA